MYRAHALAKLVRYAVNDQSHLTFENVNDLFLRMRMRRHGTSSGQRRHHLIHRIPMCDRSALDAGTNFNCRILLFHLQSLTVAAAVSAA